MVMDRFPDEFVLVSISFLFGSVEKNSLHIELRFTKDSLDNASKNLLDIRCDDVLNKARNRYITGIRASCYVNKTQIVSTGRFDFS